MLTGPIQAVTMSSVSQQTYIQGLENVHAGDSVYLEHLHQSDLSVCGQTKNSLPNVVHGQGRDRDMSAELAKSTAACLPTALAVMDDTAEHDSTMWVMLG